MIGSKPTPKHPGEGRGIPSSKKERRGLAPPKISETLGLAERARDITGPGILFWSEPNYQETVHFPKVSM